MKFILGIYVTQTHLACVVGANRGAGRGGGGDGEKREKEKERQIQIKIDLRKVCEPARLSKPHKPFFSLKLLDTKSPLGRYVTLS